MFASTLLIALTISAPPGANKTRSDVVELPSCLISASVEVDVPAAESGLLISLNDNSREGTFVKKGTILGQVDNRDALAKAESLDFEQKAAQTLAESEAELNAAIATKGVAEAEVATAEAANRRTPGSVPANEMRRLKLTAERSGFEIEVRRVERINHGFTAKAKGAQKRTMENEIDRRELKAPVDGVIVDRLKHEGEWVQPGETVFKLVGLQEVRVVGFVSAHDYAPASVAGCKAIVSVEVPGPNGEKQVKTAEGRITFVSPIVETSGDFRVWAEITNTQDEATGHWVFRPGTVGKMEILLNTARGGSRVSANARGRE